MAYTKHTWQSGETITDEKLNNIEGGVAAADTGKVNLPSGGNGTKGQFLTSNGDGTTAWADSPVNKQAAIADAQGSDEKDKINAILAALRAAGIIAAS